MVVATLGTLFGGMPCVAAADEVPKLDFRKTCRGDVQAYPSAGGNAGCVADEQKARDTLVSQWTQFDPASRARCVGITTDISGTESYVELLTCLQTAKAVKDLPKQ
jgi:hypothetical protein